jgi:hypothetical protein
MCGQNSVGTVVKTSEEDDPIAVLTALNLEQNGSLGCLKEIYSFLLRSCSDVQIKAEFEEVGLKLHEDIGIAFWRISKC